MKNKEILKLKFYSNDLYRDVTIGQYLNILLLTLWQEEDCFSGKRPLGNSDWKWDLYTALVKHGAVEDNEGYIENADKIIEKCIKDMGADYE